MLMYVSRPILEYVVFVHQEDSLWPLSENKTLKERFDAIFAATKYNDAIKRMADVVKQKTAVRFGCTRLLCLFCSAHVIT
jgi:DNA repair protein RAD50